MDKPKSFFDMLEKSDKPVLVDFYADWCGPCKMVSPAIEKIAKEYRGRLTTVKVNVDRKQHVAGHYGISSIPTIMLFWKSRAVMTLQGAQPYDAIRQQIESHWPAEAE